MVDTLRTHDGQEALGRSAESVLLDPLPYLVRAGEILAGSLDLDQTVACLLDLVVPALADMGSVHLLDEDQRLRRSAARHATGQAAYLRALDRSYLDGGAQTGPIHRLLEDGTSFMSSPLSPADLDSIVGPGRQQVVDGLGMTSAMFVPLTARGRAIGVLGLATDVRPIFRPAHLHLAEEIARRAALAIDSARLYQAASASQHAAERARQRTAFLAEASATLAASLDVRTTLRTVAQLAVPDLVDSCSVVLLDEDGLAHRVATAHVDPERQRLMEAQASMLPVNTHPSHPVAVVLATGRYTLDNDAGSERLDQYADGEYLNYLRRMGVTARLVVSLEARDRRIGALVLAMCGSGRTFDQDDVALGMELAGRAALAIDNARLYRAAVVARERLERSEERLRRSLEALLGIHEVGKLLISASDLDAVGRRVLEIAVRAARLDAAALRRRAPGGHLRLWQQVGEIDEVRAIWRAPAMKRSRARTLASGQATTTRVRPGRSDGVDVTAWCVPLVVKGETVGVLEAIGEARPPDGPTVEILGSIALQASTALENARLYGEIASSERALHRLVQQLMQAQEDERGRLAYEIHDGCAQMVAGLQQLLEAYAHDFPADSEVAHRRMGVVIGLARRTVSEIRRVLGGLRPTVLDDFGLERGLRAHVEGLAGSDLQVVFEASLGGERFSSPIEIALFRLAQEALTNVRKHAGVSAARLRLERIEGSVVLEVEDRGHGFDLMALEQGDRAGEQLGLLSMRERIAQIGGCFEIESRRGEGTLVRAVVPV